MRAPVEIYSNNGWTVTSQGNGAFYVLRHGRHSVLFQGDDALQFETDTMDSAGCWRDRCEERFGDYTDVMQEDDDQ